MVYEKLCHTGPAGGNMKTTGAQRFGQQEREEILEKIRKWEHTVLPEEAGKTLEQILKLHGFSKKEISRLKFRPCGMTVNGVQRRSTDIPEAGENIVLRLEDRVLMESIREKYDASSEKCEDFSEECEAHISSLVLYEDADLIIADKPSGLSCHPGKGHYRENLGSILSSHCLSRGEHCRIRLIGRLDLDTSGAVVFAKNQIAAARLWNQRESGKFQKYYLTLLQGTLKQEEGTINLPIGPRKGEKNRMEIQKEGQRAVTHYRVLDYIQYHGMPVTLAECHLETGRTHQIRVHMSALGHSVLGDPFYGLPDGEERLALHAYRVSLFQPFSGQPIVRTTLPDFVKNMPDIKFTEQNALPSGTFPTT